MLRLPLQLRFKEPVTAIVEVVSMMVVAEKTA